MPNPDFVRKTILAKAGNGQIFSVRFKKRSNGQMRDMTCRLGVKPNNPSSNPRSWNPADHDLMTVYDMQKGAYRMISLDTTVRLRAGGKEYTFSLQS